MPTQADGTARSEFERAPRRRTNHAPPTAAPPKPAEATPGFSSSRKGIDNSQARRYCWGQKKGGLNFLYIRVSTNGTNRNRNSLFPVLAAITTMRGLTIILWIV